MDREKTVTYALPKWRVCMLMLWTCFAYYGFPNDAVMYITCGWVWLYSSAHLLIGHTATLDVGRLNEDRRKFVLRLRRDICGAYPSSKAMLLDLMIDIIEVVVIAFAVPLLAVLVAVKHLHGWQTYRMIVRHYRTSL